MMPIEKQVVSLGLAKKLKELNCKQESLFWWFPFSHGVHKWQVTDTILDKDNIKGWKQYEKNNKDFNFYSAFTCAELGEIMKGKGIGVTAFSSMEGKWWVSGSQWIVEKQKYEKVIMADTEADARAKLLICLLENDLMGKERG